MYSPNADRGSGAVAVGGKEEVEARRLEVSVHPDDGSLLAAPLTQVVLASTDALYTDLYNMAHGEMDVLTKTEETDTQQQQQQQNEESSNNNNANSSSNNNNSTNNGAQQQLQVQTKKERMANLSFVNRRHELSWRLAQHSKGLQHVAALTAACASSDMSRVVAVSSTALQHARTAWIQADEAQDALYFFHAQLFPARAAPHDIYGAGDLLLAGRWFDLPNDLRLTVDKYGTSTESEWSKVELEERWHTSVRDNLLRGEVGWMAQQRLENQIREQKSQQQQQQQQQSSKRHREPLWKVSLRGGIVRLTQGTPKRATNSNNTTGENGNTDKNNDSDSGNLTYPIEALLTVLSSNSGETNNRKHSKNNKNAQPELPEWTLLSIEVRVQAKTGEFNHQLETSNRQRYDLHRLASIAMSREEARARLKRQELEKKKQEDIKQEKQNKARATTDSTLDSMSTSSESNLENDTNEEISDAAACIARPLAAMFQVAHTFSLSWQLEVLSAQAQALRRGVWAAGETNPIRVTPVRFYEYEQQHNRRGGDNDEEEEGDHILGAVSISFWKVDGSYGPPTMGDLTLSSKQDNDDNAGGGLQKSPSSEEKVNRNKKVAAAKTASTSSSFNNTQVPTTQQLTLSIRAVTGVGIRVSLSGGNSVMNTAAHKPHIRSTVQDLLEATSNSFCLSASDALLAATRLCSERKCHAVVKALQPDAPGNKTLPILPSWMLLTVERGSIAVAARIHYHGVGKESDSIGENALGLPILFRLLCDARTGSFVSTFPRSTALLRRLACNDLTANEPMTLRIASLPHNRRRHAGSNSSGRVVRDAFDGLIRSMNVLGQRVGVGGAWDNIDDKSASLRERSVQSACTDVRISLIKCCGMAALYGMTPLAMGAALGLEAVPDMAGEALADSSVEFAKCFLPVPPISILLDQQLNESTNTTSDGVNKKNMYMEQTLFSATCAANDDRLILFPLEVAVRLESPLSVPQRKACKLLQFKQSDPPKGNEETVTKGGAEKGIDDRNKRRKVENANGYVLGDPSVADKTLPFAEDLMVEVGRLAELVSNTAEAMG